MYDQNILVFGVFLRISKVFLRKIYSISGSSTIMILWKQDAKMKIDGPILATYT